MGGLQSSGIGSNSHGCTKRGLVCPVGCENRPNSCLTQITPKPTTAVTSLTQQNNPRVLSYSASQPTVARGP